MKDLQCSYITSAKYVFTVVFLPFSAEYKHMCSALFAVYLKCKFLSKESMSIYQHYHLEKMSRGRSFMMRKEEAKTDIRLAKRSIPAVIATGVAVR